ncbi:hypothetical protein MNV49_004235 [Pseudohyphozyma bogoriensis]|nr:hypothetical protein MNV49_004235 [Pseudohyphozyma bogoriensis]
MAFLPGSISKLKAQLRQTKRLLAKDDLTADLRLTTERRLEVLEEELEKAEKGSVEKKMVTRYRGIRFFERQKVLRKIKAAKKALAADPEAEEHQVALLEARVDLYYVVQYPKDKKYIALFPEGTFVPHDAPTSTPAEVSRAGLRESFKKAIESGKLSSEPEKGDLGIEGVEDIGAEKRERDEEEAGAGAEGETEAKVVEKEERPVKKVKASASAPVPKPVPAPQAVEEADEQEETEETEAPAPQKSTGRETKKEKKDRKDLQRKLKKEAAAKAAALASGAPAEPAAEGGAFAGDDFFA